MGRFYFSYYYMIYDLIDFFEDIFTLQSKDVRSISIIELISVMALFPTIIVKEGIVIPGIALLVLNYFVLHFNGKFRKIVRQFDNTPPSLIMKTFWILYTVLTFVGFIYTR